MLLSLFGHPARSVLSRYSDGELPTQRAKRVANHIDRCVRCQEFIAFIRHIRVEARDLDQAAVPDIADEVLRRRRAGERVLLSTGEDHTSDKRHHAAAAVAAGLLFLAGASAYLLQPPTASATRGELTFLPSTPTAGSEVTVKYSPAFYLAGEDSLRLRARVRTTESPFPRGGLIGDLRVTTLRRDGQGRFEGNLQLPEDYVFVAAAVEDFEAKEVDTNFGQLWELLAEDATGQPKVAALESRYRVLEPYNWVMASAWAEEITQRWPDSPFGWALLYYHQSKLGPATLPDSLISFNRTKLRHLIADQSQRSISTDIIARLSAYARLLGDEQLQDSLLDRLGQLDSNHAAVVDRRVLRAVSESKSDFPFLLVQLEHIWLASDHSNEFLVRLGIQTAAAAGDLFAVQSWLGRGRKFPGVIGRQVLSILEQFTELAAERVEILTAQVAELESSTDQGRPLRKSSSEHALDVIQALESLTTELAGALVDAGDTTAASALYSGLEEHVWKPEDVRPYVEFLLAKGDTAAAIPGIGLLVVDPIEGARAAAEYEGVISTHEVNSDSLFARANAELVRRVTRSLDRTRRLRIRTPLAVHGVGPVDAAEYFGGAPTVLLFWDARFPDADRVLAEFDLLAHQDWARQDIRAAVVTQRVVNLGFRKLEGTTLPVIHDAELQLTKDLRVFGIPAIVVLDDELSVLAETTRAVTAFRIASALAASR